MFFQYSVSLQMDIDDNWFEIATMPAIFTRWNDFQISWDLVMVEHQTEWLKLNKLHVNSIIDFEHTFFLKWHVT